MVPYRGGVLERFICKETNLRLVFYSCYCITASRQVWQVKGVWFSIIIPEKLHKRKKQECHDHFHWVFEGTGYLHLCSRFKHLLQAHNYYAASLQDMSFLWYIQFVCYPPNSTSMIPSTRTGYVCMYVGKYVIFKFIYNCRHYACHTVMSYVMIMWVAAA